MPSAFQSQLGERGSRGEHSQCLNNVVQEECLEVFVEVGHQARWTKQWKYVSLEFILSKVFMLEILERYIESNTGTHLVWTVLRCVQHIGLLQATVDLLGVTTTG